MNMKIFPLIKTKWSNERLMSLLVVVLIVYQLPGFVSAPQTAADFLLLLFVALAADTGMNFIRYKRPICAVSAAVTACMIHTFSCGLAPLWEQLAAVLLALLPGKHIWGGTGKNPVNPAAFGLMFIGLLHPEAGFLLRPSPVTAAASILSLPFLLFRPFAGLGMMAAMTAGLYISGGLTVSGVLSSGLFFWSCLIITDPVTITSKPVPGAVSGIVAGALPLALNTAAAMPLGILSANIISLVFDRLTEKGFLTLRIRFSGRRRLAFAGKNAPYHDFTGTPSSIHTYEYGRGISAGEILEKIKTNEVYGFGGAAFSTEAKLRSVINAAAADKHLIINGAECDPGLIHDKWLLLNRAGDILSGIGLITLCADFKTVTLAAKETGDLDLVSSGVRLFKLPDYYPVGAERTLIREVLGIELSAGMIPAERGILVLNVQTALSVYEAVCLNKRADTKYITVASTDDMTGYTARVRLGDNALSIAEKLFKGFSAVFTGGGIMNACMADEDTVVTEKTNIIAVGKYPLYKNSPLCSKCGLCAAICPARLNVREIADKFEAGKAEKAARLGAEKCVSCGICSSLCLAGRNLSALVRSAKDR